MANVSVRCGWVGRLGLLAVALSSLLTGCATSTVAVAPAAIPASEEDDFSQLIAQMRSDLNRSIKRDAEGNPSSASRDAQFADAAKALLSPLSGIRMPVVGIRPIDLDDSWGAPRDGGNRPHRGIDIFAPRGTGVVAVTSGIISYIGDQPKGGHSLWLTTESGASFYYAHLDRWAPGIYEGMEVSSGDLLGFVGNTGNAITTPPHLHFGISANDEMVNPYPVLSRAEVVRRAQVATPLGAGYGTR